VQVAAAIAKHCPFLLESDALSLSRDFRLSPDKKTLEDTFLGICHPLQTPAYELLTALTNGTPVNELRSQAAALRIEELQLTEILGFLNLTGGLQRKRQVSKWPRAFCKQVSHLCMGVVYSLLSWRRAGTAAGLSTAILRASLPVSVTTLLVGGLVVSSGIVPRTTALMAIGVGLSAFLASIFLHELAHVIAIQRSGVGTAVLQRGMRLGILHPAMQPKTEIYSALAGPITGLAAGISTAACGCMLSPVLAVIGCLIGLFHLGGLLPWYGDGASLYRALQQRRNT
jgi:hypothetical protein